MIEIPSRLLTARDLDVRFNGEPLFGDVDAELLPRDRPRQAQDRVNGLRLRVGRSQPFRAENIE